MTAQALQTRRFVRRTQLNQGEYRKNFRQIDNDILAAVTSPEADAVTALMSKIYLRLINAPAKYWEREGVLHVEAEAREGKQATAWEVVCDLVGVASATANKAFAWMHEQGIIGYHAGKNGVGIRIFLNRARASIGTRPAPCGKKILEFPPASSVEPPASPNEAGFKESFACLEVSDSDLNPRAPKNGADHPPVEKILPSQGTATVPKAAIGRARGSGSGYPPESHGEGPMPEARASANVEEVVRRLKAELESSVQVAAARAAALEHERTREWLNNQAIPKACRVAQRETYNLLRQQGWLAVSTQRARSQAAEPGRAHDAPAREESPSAENLRELAEICIAMLETQGQSIDATLSELSSESGGYLRPEDEPRVRKLAQAMARSMGITAC